MSVNVYYITINKLKYIIKIISYNYKINIKLI